MDAGAATEVTAVGAEGAGGAETAASVTDDAAATAGRMPVDSTCVGVTVEDAAGAETTTGDATGAGDATVAAVG